MRPNDRRAKIIINLFYAVIGVQLLQFIPQYLYLQLLYRAESGEVITQQEVLMNTIRQGIFQLPSIGISIAVSICFIQWFRRAYYNLHLVIPNLSFSEGWAAGSWFVPFLNLVRPYKIMREMAEETQELLVAKNLTDHKDVRTRIINHWWTFWIVNFAVERFIIWAGVSGPTLETQIKLAIYKLILTAFGIILSLITIKMIKEYSAMEKLLPLVNEGEGRALILDDSDILDSI